MSASLSTFVRPGFTNGPGTLSRLFNACCEQIACYFARSAAIKTLRELDDYALEDSSLKRSQIEGAVYGFIAPRSQG